MPRHRSRRQFLTDTAGLAWGAAIVPRHVLCCGFQAPTDTRNFAIVGAGVMGMSRA